MIPRKTLNYTHTFTGIGVHTGRESTLTLHPEQLGKGIYFVRQDLGENAIVPVAPHTVVAGERATYLKHNDISIQTPEHVLSALAGLGISDCRLELSDQEVPILDGSALPFAQAIRNDGGEDLPHTQRPITLSEPLCVKHGNASIIAIPSETFSVSYCLDYSGTVIGQQFFSLEVTADHYLSDIAPARTFGFYKDLQPLLEKGLSQGASLENVLVIGDDGYMNPPRLDLEEVKHKILDVIGDFSLLGAPLHMHLVCIASGHAMNRAMVLEIASKRRLH